MVRAAVLLTALVACGPEIDTDRGVAGAAWAPGAAYGASARTRVASVLQVPAAGLAIGQGQATAIMQGMACGIQVDGGGVFFDIELPDSRIEDSTDDPDLVLTSLAVQGSLVRLIPLANPYGNTAWLVPGVERARLVSDREFVAATRTEQGCSVRWYDAAGLVATAPVPGSCAGPLELAVDRRSGDAIVAVDGRASRIGVSVLDLGSADRVAHDGGSGLTFITDGAALRALKGAEIVWEQTLPSSAVGLAASRSEVVVAWPTSEGSAVRRLSHDGATLDEIAPRLDLTELAVSGDGEYVGISGAFALVYYRLF